jgi:hypothetical protein
MDDRDMPARRAETIGATNDTSVTITFQPDETNPTPIGAVAVLNFRDLVPL